MLLAGVVTASAACSKLERLTLVRPSAERGEFTKVAPTYDVGGKARKSAQKLPPEQQLAAASMLFTAGKLDAAKVKAAQVLDANPASGDAHTLLGLIASASNNNAAAGAHYQKALGIAPGNGAYANNYGIWLCGNGRAQESLAWFDKALADASYPTPVSAYANAGTCAQQAGQSVRAEANWRQALARDPDLLSALSGMASLQFGRGQYMDARAFVQRWLALAPNDVKALQLAIQIEQKQGDIVAVQRYLLRLQAIAPDASLAHPTQ
ncbi:MAG: tetratricopeptide repeat protein [Pseudomonadota bacterium]|nr:tetratricopeptide repeat protein [Pseudomonadota bacterium]